MCIDISRQFVSGLKLGLPSKENDLFNKLKKGKIISAGMADRLQEMKGFRNILIHEYAHVDDKLVYEAATSDLADFEKFKRAIQKAL